MPYQIVYDYGQRDMNVRIGDKAIMRFRLQSENCR